VANSCHSGKYASVRKKNASANSLPTVGLFRDLLFTLAIAR
jgi:hypothetical protein